MQKGEKNITADFKSMRQNDLRWGMFHYLRWFLHPGQKEIERTLVYTRTDVTDKSMRSYYNQTEITLRLIQPLKNN